MKDTPENRVKESIKQLLQADGWFVQSNVQFGPFVVKGRPDMEAYKDGRIILIECKRPKGGVQSKWQELYQRRVAPFAPYILARSVDDIKPYLTRTQTLF